MPAGGAPDDLRYFVCGSKTPGLYNLGGDLRHFAECIRTRDLAAMRKYAETCVRMQYANSTGFGAPIITMALVQGDALGGGFEMALSTDYRIAEEHSSFGFPEIMFGLFPCTGAMGLLSARIGARQAERMMTNKKIYTAIELYDMGLVDELCGRGEGELAVGRFIANHSSRQKARLKVQQSRYRHTPLDRAEGRRIVEDWVETAMQLSPEEIRAMDMLILMQQREVAAPARRAAVA